MLLLSRKNRWQGFTAIELLVVIAIVAILASLAAPSFRNLIETMRANNAMDGVQGGLLYARSEAVRTRAQVVMRSKDSSSCRAGASADGQDWSCGWVIFVDANRNGIQDSGENTLKEGGELAGITLTHAGGASDAFVIFNSMGYTNNTPGRFIAEPRGNTNATRPSIRTLCFSRSARIRYVSGKKVC